MLGCCWAACRPGLTFTPEPPVYWPQANIAPGRFTGSPTTILQRTRRVLPPPIAVPMITTATALVLALTSRIRTSAVFDSPAKYAPSSGFTARTHPLNRGHGNSRSFARFVVCHVYRIAIGPRGSRKAVAPNTEPCTASCCLHATAAGATIVAPIASAPATSSRQLLHGRSNGACEGAAAALAAARPSTAAAVCDCRLRPIVHRCSDVLHESFAAKWLGCAS